MVYVKSLDRAAEKWKKSMRPYFEAMEKVKLKKRVKRIGSPRNYSRVLQMNEAMIETYKRLHPQ